VRPTPPRRPTEKVSKSPIVLLLHHAVAGARCSLMVHVVRQCHRHRTGKTESTDGDELLPDGC
jgi:hypothetical protein